MSDQRDTMEKHAQRRRAFLKKTGTVAVAAPAVALLLQAGVKPAYAVGYGGGGTTSAPPVETTTFSPT